MPTRISREPSCEGQSAGAPSSISFASRTWRQGAADPEILEWAAREGRIVVSRDKSTMPEFAAARIEGGKRMPGLLLIRRKWRSQLREIIDDIVLIAEDNPAAWENRIEYLPI